MDNPKQATRIDQLFDRHVRRHPEGIAIESAGKRITYGDLGERVDALAAALPRAGLKKGQVVALQMHRSVEYVIALFASLKAGAIFVPVDASYPKERIDLMLRDAGASLVLRVRIDDPASFGAIEIQVVSEGSLNVEAGVAGVSTSEDCAYALYTSGTTGTPKAALVRHAGLTRFVTSQGVELNVGPSSRFAQIASISFDMSIWEILMPLCHGGTLVVPQDVGVAAGRELERLLARDRITHLLLTPTVVSTLRPDELPDLEVLVMGGEPCSPHLVEVWTQHTRFFEAYGPTETTVYAVIGRYDRPDETINTGTVIEGSTLHLLDAQQRPVAPGDVGEVYLGGACVGGGYLNRPELTSERFVTIASVAPGPIYRTGDLGYLRDDGRLVVRGRIDRQIKVRGFRIEPGEIEAKLVEHREVRAAVVMATGEKSPRLLAFVCPADGEVVHTLELRGFLEHELPRHMVPSEILPVAALPLTPNGKTDYRALEAVWQERTRDTRPPPESAAAPRTGLERDLVALWADILECPDVPSGESFSALGGTSLQAAILVGEIVDRFGVELDATQVREQDFTVDRLAAMIQTLLSSADRKPQELRRRA